MKLLALLAILPMAIGPLPQEEAALALSLCSGGEITIPIKEDKGGPDRDCHPKGCHAGTCREKSAVRKAPN